MYSEMHKRKVQFSDKTVLVRASQMGQFFRHSGSLKGQPHVSCLYQLVASTSCQFTADGVDLLTVQLGLQLQCNQLYPVHCLRYIFSLSYTF